MNLRRKNQAVTQSSAINIYKYDLNNKNVCISGTIQGYTRTAAKEKLKSRFKTIKFHDQVKISTDVLITGYGIGKTKLDAAKKYQLKIIDATEVFK